MSVDNGAVPPEVEVLSLDFDMGEFIDSLPFPFMRLSLVGGEMLVAAVNREAESLLSMNRANLLGRPAAVFEEIDMIDSASALIDAIGSHLSSSIRPPVAQIAATLHTSPEPTFCLVQLQPVHDFDDKFVFLDLFVIDQSILKKVQAESERTAAELRQFVETANAPIIGVDGFGLVNEWNQMAETLTGFVKSEVFGQDLVETFITPEYKASVKQVLDEALAGNEAANYEFPLYSKDGRRVDILLNATTRRNPEGEVVGVLGVGQDITELRAGEATFQRAQKMEAIGQLTGGIAHDFNNLLTIIQGNILILKDELGEVSADIEEIIADALSATSDGANLTQQLLTFARRQSLQPQEVNVVDLVNKTIHLVSRTIGEGITVRCMPRIINPIAMVDPTQLESSLLNLCLNARDAMGEKGSIEIGIGLVSLLNKLASGLAQGDYVEISVRDSGEGMTAEVIEHVFEPFFTTKELGKGSGLGLSMVMGFVEQSKGDVSISSEVGRGTTVTMRLPLVSYDSFATADQDESLLKVLVVEDEPRVKKFAVRCLKSAGYSVVTASSGDEAIDKLKEDSSYDVLFSDVVMPGGMSGRDLAREVARDYPHIKIQLATGFEDVSGELREVEGTPILDKPYGKEELVSALQKLVSR